MKLWITYYCFAIKSFRQVIHNILDLKLSNMSYCHCLYGVRSTCCLGNWKYLEFGFYPLSISYNYCRYYRWSCIYGMWWLASYEPHKRSDSLTCDYGIFTWIISHKMIVIYHNSLLSGYYIVWIVVIKFYGYTVFINYWLIF